MHTAHSSSVIDSSMQQPESEGEDEDEEKADLDVAGAMSACLSD